MAIFDSVLEGKPILILTVIMALLAGIVMWMLVRIEFVHYYQNQFVLTAILFLYEFLKFRCRQKSIRVLKPIEGFHFVENLMFFLYSNSRN